MENLNEHIEKILEYIEKKQYEEALDYICDLTPEEKSRWEIDNLTGLICSYCGDNDMAISFYQNSLKKHPDAIDNYYNLADSYLKLGDYQHAELMLKCCKHLDFDNAMKDDIAELQNCINENKSDKVSENKVLMIPYYYPPLSGSGVFRSIKFVKYLSEMNWKPTVISTDVPPNGWNFKDESMMDEIPKDVQVFRVPDNISTGRDLVINKEKANEVISYLKSIFQSDNEAMNMFMSLSSTEEGMMRLFSFPCSCLVWSWDVIKFIENNMDISEFDVIYTTSGPHSSHLIGYYLKKKYGIPWVADYRDAWTKNPYFNNDIQTNIFTRLLYRLENILLNQADNNILYADSMANEYINEYNLNYERISSITNGYDEDDFKKLKKNQNKTEKFTINYSGLLYTEQRSIEPILRAIGELINEQKIEVKKICVRVVGQGREENNKEVAKKYGLQNSFEQTGYITHKEALQTNLDSDLLVLLVGDEEKFKSIYTGKVFEYLRSGKPILAIAPKEGEVDQALSLTGHGKTFTSTQNSEIKDMILTEYTNWIERDKSVSLSSSYIKIYERRYLTMKLADIFYNVKKKPKDFHEIKAEVYNNGYINGGAGGNYHKNYKQSFYYNSWRYAINTILFLDRDIKILDIGCGVGQFANMLFDYGFTNYIGFDYAEEGVKLAKKNNPQYEDRFFVGDAFETSIVTEKYDLVICFEVLEHIQKDIELINRIQSGTKVLFSVPNFDDPYHIRYFSSEEEVYNRYKDVIDIYTVGKSMLSSLNCLYYIVGEKK